MLELSSEDDLKLVEAALVEVLHVAQVVRRVVQDDLRLVMQVSIARLRKSVAQSVVVMMLQDKVL